MDGGRISNGTASEGSLVNGIPEIGLITEEFSGLVINGDPEAESPVEAQESEKDPRKIARKYQLDLCKKALEENVVVYLGTGCGKTHIAVLLIYEMGHLIRKPQQNVCIFLAPTVALVQQQAKVIENSIDFKVGTYCGKSKHLKGHHDWERELDCYEILVMTPQILLHNLSHCFIRIELIALLIFDECHYAQLESNHPYAEIMKVFYKADASKLPRIFGMTASPKLGKGTIEGLETLLRAKVCSVEDTDELEQFVTSPKVKVYHYGPVDRSSSPSMICSRKLEEIKHQCVSAMHRMVGDPNMLRNTKKMLLRLHGNMIFCLENLGLFGALQASCILLKGDHFERDEQIDAEGNNSDDSLCDKYLTKASSVLSSACMEATAGADLSSVEVLKEPLFSKKLLELISILSNFRVQPHMKCIVFVNRIVTARSLSYILHNLKVLSCWSCAYLVGVHSGLTSMSRKNTNAILEKFRSGQLNLLVATKVGEEGLDIQTCCLVIRFDLPETVASFIQSRGRARMPQSEYAFLVDSGNEKELGLIQHFVRNEAQMNEEIASRNSQVSFVDFNERTYQVEKTGATISSGSSVSLLHHYCSKLPKDEYFIPKPQFFYFDDAEGTVCSIILPSNAPIRQIRSAPQSSIEASKRDACMEACKSLHEIGALSDFLLPDQDDGDEELSDDSDSECSDDEVSRKELHEMLVPAVLRKPWTGLENPVCLSSYYVKLCPNPADRTYREFGLFMKAPLPAEAEGMKLDLHLARGRSVMTELVPSGVAKFAEDEIQLAEKFQKMSLKVILDRSELIPESVSLEREGANDSYLSTFYLLLPILHIRDNILVDWKLIRRCLSSPIFESLEYAKENGISRLDNDLQLANGSKSMNDVVNSLVYVPCKEIFFFISDIVQDKNGYSSFNDSKSHVEHYYDVFKIRLLYPNQPLLKAKQLFHLDNLLRKKGCSESREKEEHFVELPPEICQLKILGFSKDIGSSLSLLPSIMNRLESLLVAIELKERFSAAFPEGDEVTADRVLEALTTEKCGAPFSLERLEVLGDAFLKFAVGRHLFLLHDALDEGQLTRKRSKVVNNSNLHKLAKRNNLQVYICDRSFEPDQFYAMGRPCPVVCNEETEKSIHFLCNTMENGEKAAVQCNKCHQWLYKKTVADVVEALVGAFIVDGGFKAATAFLGWLGIKVNYDPSQVTNICSASSTFLSLADQLDIATLENLLGYNFVQKGLLIQAFVHPSYNKDWGGCYQRLEFLAVLDYLITSYLYSVYPELKPGQLTDLRSASVNNNSFAEVAIKQWFHKFIICDSPILCEAIAKYVNFLETSESADRLVDEPMCPKVLGDLVESCIGAILLDSGFDLNCVWRIMLSLLKPILSFSRLRLNPIRELQELCQSWNWDMKFQKLKKDGRFLVEAKVTGCGVSASACAANISKKAAKRMASELACADLRAQGYKPKGKTLKEVLKHSTKMKPKLIGYDDTPCDIAANCCGLLLDEASTSGSATRVKPLNEASRRNYGRISRNQRQHMPPKSSDIVEYNGIGTDSKTTGSSQNKSAKSRLHELCIANSWNLPIYDCCDETGPSHLKEFTYKVVVEIEETERTLLECHGEPRLKKKDAAEHAAEGALWYLKQLGYSSDKN